MGINESLPVLAVAVLARAPVVRYLPSATIEHDETGSCCLGFLLDLLGRSLGHKLQCFVG